MKKALLALLLNFMFYDIGFADSYYFKKCILNEIISADYLIYLDKKIIKVTLRTTDGDIQKFEDKIELIKKDQIVTEKIKSSKSQDSYFIYYLDTKTDSVIKQNYKYKKISGIDFVKPDGPKEQSYCADVKGDWDKVKKEEAEKIQVELKTEKEKEKKKREERLKREAQEKKEEEENKYDISIVGKNWIKLSNYKNTSGKQLKIDFDKKASEICALNGKENFNILEKKVEIIEMDKTPAFGLEPVIKLGVKGTVECK